MLGSLGSVIYRIAMNGTDFDGLPADMVEASRSTLAAAVDAARTLGGPAPWLDLARSSFSLGFAASCAAATVALILLAIVARRVYSLNPVTESAPAH